MKILLLSTSLLFVGSTFGMEQRAAAAQVAIPKPLADAFARQDARDCFEQHPEAIRALVQQKNAEAAHWQEQLRQEQQKPLSGKLVAARCTNDHLKNTIARLLLIFKSTKAAWLTESTVEPKLGQYEADRLTEENNNLQERLDACYAKRVGYCAMAGAALGGAVPLRIGFKALKPVLIGAAIGAVTLGLAAPIALSELEEKGLTE